MRYLLEYNKFLILKIFSWNSLAYSWKLILYSSYKEDKNNNIKY